MAALQTSAARLHLGHVEGLRALAALIVYVNHAYAQSQYAGAPASFQGSLSLFTYSMVAGHLAVTVFIVISGFCLTLPVVAAGDQLRGSAAAFFRRRARRILPPYYGALALSMALILTVIGRPTGTLWDVPIRVLEKPSALLSHALLLQDLFGTGLINYVLWSIAVEWQIYFLFPLLVWTWRRLGAGRTVAAALLVGFALRFAFGDTRLERAHPQYLGMFALGMLAAHVATSPRAAFARARASGAWRWAAVAGLGVTVTLVARWGVDLSTARFHLLDLPVGVMAASVLVLSSAAPGGRLRQVLSWRPLTSVGTFSYSFYLIHAPLLQLLWQYLLHPAGLGPQAVFAALMTGGLALVLGASYLFFRLLEQPFLRPRVPVAAPAAAAA